MRIAIVHPYLNYFGGAERILAFTANHLAKKHDVSLYSYQFGNIFLKKLNFKPKLMKIPSIYRIESLKYSPFKYWTVRAYLNLIKSWNSQCDCDIINYHNVPAPWMVNGSGKKIWFCQEPLRAVYDKSLNLTDKLSKELTFLVRTFASFYRYFDVKKLRTLDTICVNSIKMKKIVDEIYNADSIVLPMPVHFSKEKNFNYKKRDVSSSKFHSILIVNGVQLDKGVIRTLYSLKEILKTKKFLILIEGENRDKNLILKIVKELNLVHSVQFIGRAKNVTELYKTADFVLVNSINEPFGLTAVEGMYFGCIPLIREDAGVSYLIDNATNGFVFKTEKKLKNLLEDILERKYDLEMIRKNASLFVRNHCSLQKFNDVLDQIFL